MKYNEQQSEWLKGYLGTVLKYRETCEEVYDHILVALENRPEKKSFESVVDEIIESDFGGNNGLMMMEINCRNAVISEVRKRYWQYFFSYFKFPDVIYLLAFFLIVGYMAMHLGYNVIYFSGLIWAMGVVLTPVLLRKLKISHKLDSPKKSLKNNILIRLSNQPFRFFWCYIFFFPSRHDQFIFDQQAGLNLWTYIGPLILLAMFVAATIHCLSFIKLIRDEFNMSLVR